MEENRGSSGYIMVPAEIAMNKGIFTLSALARLLYILYLSRYKLSTLNEWQENGEYFIFCTRKEAMELLGVGYKAVYKAHHELVDSGFVREKRQGKGFPNRIYFSPEGKFKKLPQENSGVAQKETLEVAAGNANNIDKNNIENNNIDNNECMSVCTSTREENRLQKIFSRCDFSVLSEPAAELFKKVITRMYYSKTVKNGEERLPREQVRQMLDALTTDHLIETALRLYQNYDEITNTAAYIKAVLINIITEDDTAHLIRRHPQYLKNTDFFSPPEYLGQAP